MQTVTLTGTYQLPNGTPAKGTVEIIPSVKLIVDDQGNVIMSGRAKVSLDAEGSFTVDLPATDDITLNPTGFGYTLVAKLNHTHLPAVSFQLPAAVPVVDVTDVTEVDASTFTPQPNYSAYIVALEAGFEGTIEEWLETLVGPQGPPGADSTVPGPAGQDGADGASTWADISGKPATFKPDVTDPDLSATIAAAVGDTGGSTGTGGSIPTAAWNFMQVLETNVGPATLAVSGDSVSAGDSWVRGLAERLGERYPAYTVVFKAKTGGADTYLPDALVQTGTGSHTLTVYNWSQSGAPSGEGMTSDALLPTAYPVAPDLLLIATGHNDLGATARERQDLAYVWRESIARFRRFYPECPVAAVLVNPRLPADAKYVEMLTIEREKVRLASRLGMSVLDLHRPWFEREGGYADLLADTTHPNELGHDFQAGLAFDQLATAAVAGLGFAPSPPPPPTPKIHVPLMGGAAHTGTPAVEKQYGWGSAMGVAFDPAAEEVWVTPTIDVPDDWGWFAIDLYWTPQANGAGTARFRVDYSPLSVGLGVIARHTLGEADAVVSGGGVAGFTHRVQILGNFPPQMHGATARDDNTATGPYAPFQFLITRLAAHANDTLASDALVYGLRLSRLG